MQDKVKKDCNCKEVKTQDDLKEAIKTVKKESKVTFSHKLRTALVFIWYQTEITFSSIWNLFKNNEMKPKISKRLNKRLQKELRREQ